MDFVKEGKVDEENKKRQAEWERVRKKDDPIEAPPEVFDNRSLYDKLKEQHEIKKKDFEDKYAFKNQMRGIDDEEAGFLNEIDEIRLKKEREVQLEERKEVEELKKAFSSSSTTSSSIPKITVKVPTNKKEKKQTELLANKIVTKRKISSTTSATTLLSSNTSPNALLDIFSSKKGSDDEEENANKDDVVEKKKLKSSTQIIAGILPGLGQYDSDSSSLSDETSDDEENERTLDTNAIINRNSSDVSGAGKLTKL